MKKLYTLYICMLFGLNLSAQNVKDTSKPNSEFKEFIGKVKLSGKLMVSDSIVIFSDKCKNFELCWITENVWPDTIMEKSNDTVKLCMMIKEYKADLLTESIYGEWIYKLFYNDNFLIIDGSQHIGREVSRTYYFRKIK